MKLLLWTIWICPLGLEKALATSTTTAKPTSNKTSLLPSAGSNAINIQSMSYANVLKFCMATIIVGMSDTLIMNTWWTHKHQIQHLTYPEKHICSFHSVISSFDNHATSPTFSLRVLRRSWKFYTLLTFVIFIWR